MPLFDMTYKRLPVAQNARGLELLAVILGCKLFRGSFLSLFFSISYFSQFSECPENSYKYYD